MNKTLHLFAIIIVLVVAFSLCFGLVAYAEPEEGYVSFDASDDENTGAGDFASPAPEGVSSNGTRTISIEDLPCKDQPFYFYEIANFNIRSNGSEEKLHVYVEKDDGKTFVFIADDSGKTILPAEGNNARSYCQKKFQTFNGPSFSLIITSTSLSVDDISLISGADSISGIAYYDSPGFGDYVSGTTPAETTSVNDINAASDAADGNIKPESDSDSPEKEKGNKNLLLILAAAVLVALVIVAAVLFALKRKKKSSVDNDTDYDLDVTPKSDPIAPVSPAVKTVKTNIPVGINDPISFDFKGNGKESKSFDDISSASYSKPLPPDILSSDSQAAADIISDSSSAVMQSNNGFASSSFTSPTEVNIPVTGLPENSGPASVSPVPPSPPAPVAPSYSAPASPVVPEPKIKSDLHEKIMDYYRGKSAWDFPGNGFVVSCVNDYNIGLGQDPQFKIDNNVNTGYAVFDNRFLYLYSSSFVGSSFKLFSEYKNVESFYILLNGEKPDTVRGQDIVDILPAAVRFENDSFVLEKKGTIYTK